MVILQQKRPVDVNQIADGDYWEEPQRRQAPKDPVPRQVSSRYPLSIATIFFWLLASKAGVVAVARSDNCSCLERFFTRATRRRGFG